MRHWPPMTRTWPDDWDARKQGVNCWFCGDQFGEPFHVGRVGSGYLERHPIARGHAIVVFRPRHVADFTRLTSDEAADYWRDVQAVARLVEQVFAPCHMNFQLLGNLVPHLHVHLVPRYLDDAAPGRPLPFEPQPLDAAEFERQCQRLTDAAKGA